MVEITRCIKYSVICIELIATLVQNRFYIIYVQYKEKWADYAALCNATYYIFSTLRLPGWPRSFAFSCLNNLTVILINF